MASFRFVACLCLLSISVEAARLRNAIAQPAAAAISDAEQRRQAEQMFKNATASPADRLRALGKIAGGGAAVGAAAARAHAAATGMPLASTTSFANSGAASIAGTGAAKAGAGAALYSEDGIQQKFISRGPRVFFLFMAVDKISNLDVWKAFFADAPVDQYRALIHCKLPSCNNQVVGSVIKSVPTVPSYYCTDLVSPMNQLLAYALADDSASANVADKFAFVSDSTLPGKPFSQIYATLSVRRGSDFCAFPSAEWADVPDGRGGLDIAVKHHQWITLERSHAQKVSILWSGGRLHDFMSRFQMNRQQYTYANNSFGDTRNFGCLDEFWHMAALYGPLTHIDSKEQVVNLAMFTGGPLRVAPDAGWQGECDTFVIWAKYLHTPGNNPFERLYNSLDPSSVPHGGNPSRPGWWDQISTTGLESIRQSSFLFVRKFIDNPKLVDGPNFVDAYRQVVFGNQLQTTTPFPTAMQAYR